MKISINALAMRSVNHGVGNYIANLVVELAKAHPKDKFRIFITASNKDLPVLLSSYRNVRFETVKLPRPFRLIWEQVVLPMKVRSDDLLHCPVHVLPIIKTTRYVVTELDLTFFIEPKRHTLDKQIYFKSMIPMSCRVADEIISISQSTANDLIQILKVPTWKITVIPLAASASMKRVTDDSELKKVRTKYSLPKNFILLLGVLEPRKNVVGLLEAYSKITKELPLDLVIAGNEGYGWDKNVVYDKVRELGLTKKVYFIGRVDEKDKAALYTLSRIFVYPSFYEGFGLPVLEAMQCGVPVITSKGSSLEEISGTAALLINPYDPREIADKIKQLSEDEKLHKSLVKKGYENSRKFNWKITAELTYEIYKKLT